MEMQFKTLGVGVIRHKEMADMEAWTEERINPEKRVDWGDMVCDML